MKVLVLGSGLMGPGAAFNAMSAPDVSQVTLCDVSQAQLDEGLRRLAGLAGAHKLATGRLDLEDQPAAVALMQQFDVLVGALPHAVTVLAVRAAIEARRPFVDMARLDELQFAELAPLAEQAGVCIIVGAGVEPGLTEIMTRHLAERLDRVDEVHILCGGIPEHPTPPLGYKIVFGGRRMPLRPADAQIVENGQLVDVPRYSGVETVVFSGVGVCEAWHEGFMPWLLDLPQLKDLKSGTQKTVRWPGYAARASVLRELGLLSMEPVDVDGVRVKPKQVLDAVLDPHVRLEEGERDLTLFRVEVLGEQDGYARRYRVEMVDRYDDALHFTSMARTTAFTAAIIARMVAQGEIVAAGVVPPEQVITGPSFDRLVAELAASSVRFEITTEQTAALLAG